RGVDRASRRVAVEVGLAEAPGDRGGHDVPVGDRLGRVVADRGQRVVHPAEVVGGQIGPLVRVRRGRVDGFLVEVDLDVATGDVARQVEGVVRVVGRVDGGRVERVVDGRVLRGGPRAALH